ncbi:uncharacterized protein ssh isoform X2 [Macrobrachium rosenbergii]|uniref:uncharacterized protein ssh isoform X2 n=1 Tax=Macrobrachium rosenbergii TaxID=79674 RepID=UPI0034D3F44B
MKYYKDPPEGVEGLGIGPGGLRGPLVPLKECPQSPENNMMPIIILRLCGDKNHNRKAREEEVGGVAKALQRERHRRKRREKENLWRRKNDRNARQEPVVIHYPARSALQTLHKSSSRAQGAHYFLGGLNHDWVGYYERGVTSDQSCINEWNAMDSLESRRPPSPDSLTNKEETEYLIRSKLKAIMTQVDIDEVTSKYIRQRLEEELAMDLFKFKSYIDQEMLVILGQMDAATEIFPHVYLGSEWNASNLEELQKNGVGYILNVTKEIDNFYPGTFDYLNIRVYDDEKTELLKHWDSTFKYIAQVKARGSKVLVHCKMGISRSASVVIAYAMKAFNMSLEEALNLVKKKRTCIKPNQAFCNQLKTYEGILDASRQRHNILWRSKSETNLKSAAQQPLGRSAALRNRPPNMSDCTKGGGNREKSLLHKSTEELAKYDHQAFDATLSVRVPGSCCDFQGGDQGRRPKSWSPDDHTAGMLFPKSPGEGGSDFGESWRLSQSLNVQSWRAHVTLQQRDLRDFSIEGSNAQPLESPVVEALNPLYTDIPSGSTINEVSSLQLSSSVKERINEFESVQTTTQPGANAKGQNNPKKGDVVVQLQNVTTSSSDDFSHCSSSTAELDKVIETLLSPSEEELLQGSEPVVSQTKPAAQRHQAVLVPSQIWQEEKAAEVDEEETMDIILDAQTQQVLPKDPVVLPAGIVKRQKQDFEEKVKMSGDSKHGNSKDGDSPLSRQSSSGSLSGQFPKVEVVRSPSYGRQDSGGSDVVKRDDPFSVKLDKVFDREERKQQRLSAVNPQVGEIKETPSRNSSWGSFDSAVVLPDREFPSRQSSWGSCDTRTTVPSRNSSFGPFDIKQQQPPPPPLKESADKTRSLRSNISGTYFERDTGMFSPGTIRRNKGRTSEVKYDNAENVKLDATEMDFGESAPDDSVQSKPVANVKAYGPAPYKSPVERVAPMELSDDVMMADSPEKSFDHHHSTPTLPVCIPDSTNTSVLTRSQPNISSSCTTIPTQQKPTGSSTQISEGESSESESTHGKGGGGGGSPIAEMEVLIPGTVKQQKELLESKTQETSGAEQRKSYEKPTLSPTCLRSQSYCEPGFTKMDSSLASSTTTKCSLGRSFSEKRAKFEGPSEADATEGGKVKKLTQALEQQKNEEKLRALRMKGIRKRSHSLEILNTSPISPTYSSHLLDEILVQTEADMRDLEKESSAEEICVKSLVGKFEDPRAQGPPRVQTRNVRAKSDSSTPDRFLPPVPQRKSSLDYNFKPPNLRAQSQPPPLTSSVKQTQPQPLLPPLPGAAVSPTERLPSPGKAPSHKPPPGGRGQTCGVEVRQKKQQGKTHPLTKLTKTNRENYHTM